MSLIWESELLPISYSCCVLQWLQVISYFGGENGRWENGASVKIPRKVCLGTKIRALEDESGADSNSQGLAPHNPSRPSRPRV